MNEVRIRLKEFPHWIFLFHCTLLTSSASLRVASTSVSSQRCFNVIFLFHCRLVRRVGDVHVVVRSLMKLYKPHALDLTIANT